MAVETLVSKGGIMAIFLGISLTLNIISGIIFFLMYRYSFKGFKKKIENGLLNNFMGNSEDIERTWESLWSENSDDNK